MRASFRSSWARRTPGTTIKLEVIREGKNVTVPVTLEAMSNKNGDEEFASTEHGKPRWGWVSPI